MGPLPRAVPALGRDRFGLHPGRRERENRQRHGADDEAGETGRATYTRANRVKWLKSSASALTHHDDLRVLFTVPRAGDVEASMAATRRDHIGRSTRAHTCFPITLLIRQWLADETGRSVPRPRLQPPERRGPFCDSAASQ